MSNVVLKWTLPAFKKDGTTPLNLADITAVTVKRDGVALATDTTAQTSASKAYTDLDVPNGDHAYVVSTSNSTGESDDSNTALVTIAVIPPVDQAPAAVSDLAATVQ